MGIDLPLIWAVIIIFGIMMYVVMDGFDLGIGILFPFVPGKTDRDVMMNTVAPVWDGNETWLVLGGAALFGAFPLAYSVVLSALYLPLIFMLMGLIFRGVAFEFRFKAKDEKRHLWDEAFIGGSIAATFFQGVALGAFIDGLPVVNRQFAGGSLDWLTPFTLFCGAAAGVRPAGSDRYRQPVDTPVASGNRLALVQHAESVLVHAGADSGAGHLVRPDPRGGT
jgi:cytochrome d ubiquinol oxidase subunit II